ncbi:hypothetical protein BDY21DRAFT_75345 [Lineolata rhizophorae]|uniref:Secreted protein n=1 Tax=Lineolata rhizophorae TaxID=578093 RepID=A0A6A6NUZ1_9PEZI|nr:hypothetical protein BDY21DRAFT_75345 [Lineolata rhizophorae]
MARIFVWLLFVYLLASSVVEQFLFNCVCRGCRFVFCSRWAGGGAGVVARPIGFERAPHAPAAITAGCKVP